VFGRMLTCEESDDDRTVAAMGIMNTLESILSVMEDHKEVVEYNL
jgi:hypothetical protein